MSQFFSQSDSFLFKPLEFYSKEKFETIGKAYLEKIHRLNDEAPRITDKLPFNFMMVGLIRLALPNAKIIHCVRDPRDIGLSIYRQNFATENYRFAYDLKTIGQFCKLYRRLMEHWQAVLSLPVHTVRYEELAQNQEQVSRELVAFCGLDWEDSCLEFHTTRRPIATASHSQARQPLYQTSIGKWRHYSDHLDTLVKVLGKLQD